jgi:CHAT domain-containing protein
VLPILDTETWPLMVAFHDRLRSGEPVAAALASAQQELASGGSEGIATAAGFLCFGAGFIRPSVAGERLPARDFVPPGASVTVVADVDRLIREPAD